MRVDIDLDADAGYITVSDAAISRTVDVSGSVSVDIDSSGNLVGIEILGSSPWSVADIEATCTVLEPDRIELLLLTGHRLLGAQITPLQVA